MASRTESKARDSIKLVNAALSEPAFIEHLQLDLSSLKSVQAAAQRISASSERLDILILNAGIAAVPAIKSETGRDTQLSFNHIGHFTLTKLLLPLLEKTAAQPGSDVWIISLASKGYQMSPSIDIIIPKEKLEKTGNWTCYGVSKASNLLFAAEMARRYPIFKTPNSERKSLVGFFSSFGERFGKSVQEGALNGPWCAAGARREELRNGGYYTPAGKHKSINK